MSNIRPHGQAAGGPRLVEPRRRSVPGRRAGRRPHPGPPPIPLVADLPRPAGLPRRVHAGYASGSLVTGAFTTVPGLLLLPYLTDTLGVAAGLAGVLVFAAKAWTVLLNPVAGRVSDRTTTLDRPAPPVRAGRGPRGRRRVRADVRRAVHRAVHRGAGCGWAVGGYLLASTAFAFFQAPYAAMPAEMTDDYAERPG